LNDKQIKLASFISKHYFTHIHNSVSLFFPKNLKEKIAKDKLNPLLISPQGIEIATDS